MNAPCLKGNDYSRGHNPLNKNEIEESILNSIHNDRKIKGSLKFKLITAYRIVNSSSPDWIFQWLTSVSTNAAMTKNWINPKRHVKEVTESFAGYFFNTGACKILIHILAHKVSSKLYAIYNF